MSSSINEPIAIIGTACRFAGDATSPSKLWELLREPRDVRREIPDERFSSTGFYHPNGAHHGHSNIRHAYMVNEDIAVFDAEFFGIKPLEAKAIDPQQRVLMETVYEGLEDAGLGLNGLRGTDTSVYVGVMCNDYEALLLRELQQVHTYHATGVGRSILSNRVSYFFDWHGPSITIDTACSSSLVAVHMAVQTLRTGESRVAVACGSNLLLGPENFILESKLKMLSPVGQSKMWDRTADGYARGDGVGAIIMKTLTQAIADGDNIDCIIRETGLNQDGATTGITMPSSVAQKALIISTYKKAGLDIHAQKDRPQYFEAHGTGTPAGDPIEAEAIAKAFYGDEMQPRPGCDPLYVGSIKTVLGHTEGTAGIAAVLKAAMALKSSVIPPNLLFDKLSDSVRPFYKNLEIPTAAIPWPETHGGPRRTSVNCFGFGGTNAHAILESYEGPSKAFPGIGDDTVFAPFTFSAGSENSLRKSLLAFSDFLASHKNIDIHDLGYTLRQRRSLLPYRTSITAGSAEELQAKIALLVDDKVSSVGLRAPTGKSSTKILGVFTGQGAQYARMGAELLERSPKAQNIMQELESYLAVLPDSPTWSLQAELLANADKSRLGEAAISQPLCTAVQIMVLKLLGEASVKLDGVIGHSSGEIAAAYAAGFLTARDAMVIAYYRGVYTKLSASPTGAKGAMIAVGTSLEDAQAFCDDKSLVGHINVAACNSSSSITISGDEDAIDALQVILQDEKIFNRKLRVDQAYHSKHMLPASDPYIRSVRAAGVKALKPAEGNDCMWVSSVYNKIVQFESDIYSELGSTYWAKNMTQTVLFSQALSSVLKSGPEFDLAIELGPHAALKGPATQTIQEVLGKAMPYTGTLIRSGNAVESLATSLGLLWAQLDTVDLQNYDLAVGGHGKRTYSVLKGLPTYAWNHETRHWHESRRSRKMRTRQAPFHSLLGDVSPDSAPNCLEWHNMLRPAELPWLDGHRVQSQAVFPAAGYAATAFEAARRLADGRPIRLINLKDLNIQQAVAFSDEDFGVEVIIRAAIMDPVVPNRIKAQFTYLADLGSNELTVAATGVLDVLLGEPSPSTLPSRSNIPPHTIAVETGNFYRSLADLGYNFSGRFQSLSDLRRKHGFSTCAIKMPAHVADDEETLFAHPAELDASFQSIILAYAYPYDDQLRIMQLPASISCITLNPALCGRRQNDEFASVDAWLQPSEVAGQGFTGNCTIYSPHSTCAAIRVEGLAMRPLGNITAHDDRKIFSEMHWFPDSPTVDDAAADTIVTNQYKQVRRLLERVSTYYLREFIKYAPWDLVARQERPNSCYLNYAKDVTARVARGENPWVEETWQKDKMEDILKATNPYEDSIPDIKIMHLVGQQMPRVFRGETTMLEEFLKSSLLDNYYTKGFGFEQVGKWLSRVLGQISNRYPHMKIMEIGAGTGGATKSILPALGKNFLNYTFTDVSTGFFERAASVFADYKEHMNFKVFDIERDPLEQGYAPSSYDVIVGSLVIHATARLEKTLNNIRKLLKPGGYLVIGEGSPDCPHGSFIFGPLSGWWLGVDEDRTLTPMVSREEWDRILKKTGFSGIDTITPQAQEDVYGTNIWVAQAVNEEVQFIRGPLASPPASHRIEKLAIVGGKTTKTARIVNDLKSLLKEHAIYTHFFETLADVDYELVDDTFTVVSLADLDGAVFDDIQPGAWQDLKQMFEVGKTLLWLTSGREADQPYANMMVGFGRAAMLETPGLRLQFLDVPDATQVDSRRIAEALLRLQVEALEDNSDLLWTVESEIIMDTSGQSLIPRLREAPELNDRYNSAFRSIQHEVDIDRSSVQLHYNSSFGFALTELPNTISTSKSSGLTVGLQIMYSLPFAQRAARGYKYVIIAEERSSKKIYMALVSSLTSNFSIPRNEVVEVKPAGIPADTLLSQAAAYLAAVAICDSMFPGDIIAVHNAPSHIAKAIDVLSSEMGLSVSYTTDSSIPPYLSRSEARRHQNISTMSKILASSVRKETVHTLYSSYATPSTARSSDTLREVVQMALKYAEGQVTAINPVMNVPLEAVRGQRIDTFGLSTIVDWTTTSKQLVEVSRLDSGPMFKSDKTYWMVGLSGTLGLSLCDWMINKGARHLVLTSRNPKISSEWVQGHAANGVNVTILPCDITNEPRLRAIFKTICKTLPPIIGVLNGAMVLQDISILNMSYDQLVGVTNPKVLGSIFLDRIFDRQPLDFFIFMSSLTCVTGNLGQANYAAANMFMCAMAANRRKRGLTASALNIGAIIGAGYMERQASKALDLTISKMALMHLSEPDFHQLFAEGIKAGLPTARNGPELTTGLLDVDVTAEEKPKWSKDPKFLCFINHRKKVEVGSSGQAVTITISDRLGDCKTEAELLNIVQDTFATQLQNILQMSTPYEDLMRMRSSEIGLDSLISVDMRAWFLKHYQVNIPVLKIMGNDTMDSIARYAVEGIPPEIVPQLHRKQVSDEETSSSESSTPMKSGVLTPDGQYTPADTLASSVSTLQQQKTETPRRVDYEFESAPPADFADLIMGDKAPSMRSAKSKPKAVLLTGVSGLLGHHLLDHLLDNEPQVKKVVCIAVRQLHTRVSKLRQDDRISYYEGDLTAPRLGLSEEEAAVIFDEIDAVIHSGADTSHLKFYWDIKAANMLSTQFLVRMCLPRQIPIHYVSSRLSKSYGLKVWIHRPPTIIREGNDTIGRAAEMDWVNALVDYSHRLKTVPKCQHAKGVVNFVYVSNTVNEIAKAVVKNAPKSPVTYVHPVVDLVLPLDDMKILSEMDKGQYRETSMAEWASMAIDAGLHPAVAAFIEMVDSPGAIMPRLLTE
ncbi:putative polyketide synthase [Xylaria arbuscula]|nr:putative polyketide synthase [Xylaria arbuscula]